MAFHAAAFTVSTTTNGQVVAAWPTTSPGDDLYAVINIDDTGAGFTPPTGWTAVGAAQVMTLDGGTAQLFHFSGNGGAGAPSVPPTTDTWVFSGSSSDVSAILVSLTGRAIGATSFVTQTLLDTSHAPGVSVSLNGGTASTGDDLLVFISFDPTGGYGAAAPAAPTGSPGTFIERGIVDGLGSPADSLQPSCLASLDNSPAGATGVITQVLPPAGGLPNTALCAWVIASSSSSGGGSISLSVGGIHYQTA